MRIALAALTFVLLPSVAQAADEPWPIQLTVAGGSNEQRPKPDAAEDSLEGPPATASVAALWLSTVVPLAPRQTWRRQGGLFVAPGGELTVDGEAGPYQWSAGGGMRLGYAFRGLLEAPIPDAILFVRATPFVGMRRITDEDYLGEQEATLTRRGLGMRLGVGITAPLWSAAVLGTIAQADMGSSSDAQAALVCFLFGAAAVLFNHVELTWEGYREPGLPAINRVGIRLGTGF